MSKNRHIEDLASQAKQLSGEALTEFFSRLTEVEKQAVASEMADGKQSIDQTSAFDSDGELSNKAAPNHGPMKNHSLPKKAGLKSVGNYKILQAIGQGGMGQVFLAEQEQPVRRRVALKIIKSDAPSKEILARFEAERQALALMEHPNIAKVLDAGVTQNGRPYFAMELVKGAPIAEYCDKHKLSPNERLELFVQTCRAIQHAHMKGIVHRDIKPSNILVASSDDKPIVKVIDFGLAKAMQEATRLTDRTMFTQFGQVLGTLAYMSPEQAEMNSIDIDTRTDVYSLGVVLYELLTGSTPLTHDDLRNAALDRILSMIREQEAPRPSQRLGDSGEKITSISSLRRTEPKRLSFILKGDLDWIVMKALEKERSRRYDTAAALADDVLRYLNEEVVVARPPSWGYRAQKTFRKHRKAFLAVASMIFLLIAGLIGTGTMWFRASKAEVASRKAEGDALVALGSVKEERDRANRQEAKAREEAARADKNASEALENELAARKSEYVANIRLAAACWTSNDVEGWWRALQLCVPEGNEKDLRGWEWYYLSNLASQQLAVIDHEDGEVTSVAVLKNGNILTGSMDGKIRLVSSERPPTVSTLTKEKSGIVDLVALPYGEVFAYAFGNCVKTVTVKEVDKPILTGFLRTNVKCLAVSPTGEQLAAAGYSRSSEEWNAIKIWNTKSRLLEHELKGHKTDIHAIEFHPTKSVLVSSDLFGLYHHWDPSSGELIHSYKLKDLKIPGYGLKHSADGNSLLASSIDGDVVDVAHSSGKLLRPFQSHSAVVIDIALSPDGSLLSSCGRDGKIHLSELSSGTLVRTLKGHSGPVISCAFVGQDELVSASIDRTARVWDLRARENPFVSQPPSGWVSGRGRDNMQLFPDEGRISYLVRDGVAAYATSRDRFAVIKSELETTIGFASCQDGSVLFYGENDYHYRDFRFSSRSESTPFTYGALSRDGKQIAMSDRDGRIALRAENNGFTEIVVNHGAYVNHLEFDSSARTLLSTGGGVAKAWSTSEGVLMFEMEIPRNAVAKVHFSPSGNLLVVCDGMATLGESMNPHCWIYEISTRRKVGELTGFSEPITDACFSHDGKRLLATGGEILRVFDATDLREILSLNLEKRITGIAIGKNGTVFCQTVGGAVVVMSTIPRAQ